MKTEIKNTDAYIAAADAAHQPALETIRTIIRKAAPKAEEVISYGMPAFKQHGVLVYFAAAKKHLGFYPTGSPTKVFANELKDYVTTKGAIQFPYDRKLPVGLITKIVKFRLQEDALKAAEKAIKKTPAKKAAVKVAAKATTKPALKAAPKKAAKKK